ncbi:MAG: nodulation protein [Pseudonocardiales bacterium]|nr:nodulation protein [Pseudonocardiales bacterium]
MNAGSAAVEWTSVWEDDVADHEGITALLGRAFPRSRTPFTGARSWSSARPELRLLGLLDGLPVAHVAVLRRFLQIGGHAQLVGDVGLVAVDPGRHGSGLGAELLVRTRAELAALEMPFGFLTCGEQVAGFYARGGWSRVDGPTRMVRADGEVQVYGGVSMALAVSATSDAWPCGQIDRNGLEV